MWIILVKSAGEFIENEINGYIEDMKSDLDEYASSVKQDLFKLRELKSRMRQVQDESYLRYTAKKSCMMFLMY